MPPIEEISSIRGPTAEKDDSRSGTDTSSGGYLFVASTGQKSKQKDRKQIKIVRAHVMHNYLERNQAGQQQKRIAGERVTGEPPAQSQSQNNKDVAGQKLRFRLKSDGLELRHPYRYKRGKKQTSTKGKEEGDGGARATTDKSEPSRSPGRSQEDRWKDDQAASDAGFVPGMPLRWLPLTTSSIDVFGVLPIRLGSSDERSLALFSTYERFPWCPISGHNTSWSTFAVSDQLVFHATMFSWGMHFRGRRPTPDREEELQTIRHKLAAISLINRRLSDTTQAVSDETIAAVAALTNIALVVDSFPEASKHMQGLKAIVDMRGGLSTLGGKSQQQHLQRLISWNDLIYSEVFDESLRFPPIEVWDESWGTLQQPTAEALPGLTPHELRAAGVPSPKHELTDLLGDMRRLCDAEQLSPLSITNDLGRMRRGDMFHRIERRLRLINQENTAPGNTRWEATVWRVVALAAQIFTHHHLRGNPVRYRHFGVLSTQLHDTLLTMSPDLAELDFAPALAVWILSTGAVVSNGEVHLALVTLLQTACQRYGLVEWERFHWTLSQFLWTGEADEKRALKLWTEVQGRLEPRDQ